MESYRHVDEEEFLAIAFHNLPILPEASEIGFHTEPTENINDGEDRLDWAQLPPNKRLRQTYDCEPCGVEYDDRRSLARHYRTDKHRTNLGLTPEPKLPCGYCGKTFSRGHDRVRHEREQHLGLKRLSTIGDGTTTRRMLETPSSRSFNFSHNTLPTLFESVDEQPVASCFRPPTPQSPSTQLIRGAVVQHCNNTNELNEPLDRWDDPIPLSTESDSIRIHSRGFGQASGPEGSSLRREASHRTASTGDSGIDMDFDKVPGAVWSEPMEGVEGGDTSVEVGPEIKKTYRYGVVFDIPIRPNKALIKAGANRRPKQHRTPPPCKLCFKSLGNDIVECRAHLKRHFVDLQAEHLCTICQIGFKLETDLKRHQQCASGSQAHCGFTFDHNATCSGHHPPDEVNFGELCSDRFKLLQMLSNWEQAIIQLQLDYVNNLLVLPALNVEPDAWTAPAKCRKSVVSDRSSTSYLGWRSNPDYVDYQI